MSTNEGPGARSAEVAPRRRLTERLRQRISYLKLVYSLTEPLDFTTGEEMPYEESWYVDVEEDNSQIGHLAVHTVPLYNLHDLHLETDSGDDIPGHPVSVVTEFDSPTADVLRRCGYPDQDPAQRFLVVENVELSAPWRGLRLEALLLTLVLEKLHSEHDLFAVAEPVPWHLKGKARTEASRQNKPVFAELGFEAYRSGVWLLTDLLRLWPVRDALCERFRVRHLE